MVYSTAALPPTTIIPLWPVLQETFSSTSCGILHCSSPLPRHNHTGWVGVKHQLIYHSSPINSPTYLYGLYHRKTALPPTTILPLQPIPQETISTSCGIPPLQLSHQPPCCPYGLYHRINLFPCSIPHGSFPTNRHTSPAALAARILAGKESQTWWNPLYLAQRAWRCHL